MTVDQEALLHKLGIGHVVLLTDNPATDKAGLNCVHQVKAMTQGIRVSVGLYRHYWYAEGNPRQLAKDPGDLTPARIRKMYHSAISWHQWKAHV
ncbi:MAG: hypothetical protein GY809_07190 [Planctomycetes bacterium]|nr:hypothetical protein [Planctomycetota bacterium]